MLHRFFYLILIASLFAFNLFAQDQVWQYKGKITSAYTVHDGTTNSFNTEQSLTFGADSLYGAFVTLDSARLQVLKYEINSTWVQLGGSLADSVSYPKIAVSNDGSIFVAYIDSGTVKKTGTIKKIVVRKYNEAMGSWDYLGSSSGFSSGNVISSNAIGSNIDLAVHLTSGVPYVSYIDNGEQNKVIVMKYNGITWQSVGPIGVSDGGANYPNIEFDVNEDLFVSYQDSSNSNKVTVMKFNTGINSWEAIGLKGFSASSSHKPGLIGLCMAGTTPYIAYINNQSSIKRVVVMKYDGSTWLVVGSTSGTIVNASREDFEIKTNQANELFILYHHPDNVEAVLKKLEGSVWKDVGYPSNSPSANSKNIELAFDNAGLPYLSFYNNIYPPEGGSPLSGFFLTTMCEVPKPVNITPSLTICSGENITLLVTSGTTEASEIGWYNKAELYPKKPCCPETGVEYFGGGTSLVVGPLFESTTFYVQDSSACYNNLLHYNGLPRTEIEVTVAGPEVSVTSDKFLICKGDNTTLYAESDNAVSYLWSTNENTPSIVVSPTSTSGFSVTAIDAFGCSRSKSILITVSAPIITIAGPDSICKGDSFVLTAEGGYSYLWNTGETSESINTNSESISTYSVIGYDNEGNCSSDKEFNVTLLNLPSVTIMGNDQICGGTNSVLTASGANSYVWSTLDTSSSISISPIENSTFSVVGTDIHNCKNEATKTINVTPNLNINGPDTACLGTSITLIASGAISYLWSNDDTTEYIEAAPIFSKYYYVTGTDNNGCLGQTSFWVTVDSCNKTDVGFENEIGLNKNVILFPNPSNGLITIDFSYETSGPIKYGISDMIGTNIISGEIIVKKFDYQFPIDLSHLSKGVYMFSIYTDGDYFFKKIILE